MSQLQNNGPPDTSRAASRSETALGQRHYQHLRLPLTSVLSVHSPVSTTAHRGQAGDPSFVRGNSSPCLVQPTSGRHASPILSDRHGRQTAANQQTARSVPKASRADKGKILDRVVVTAGMGRSTARRMLADPRLPDPPEQVETGAPLRVAGLQRRRQGAAHVWALIGMPCGKYRVVMVNCGCHCWPPPVILTSRSPPSRHWRSRRR